MNEQEEHREQLSAYLDGELAEEEARRVEERIQRDPELAEELAQIRSTRELLRGLPRQPAPDGFASRVISRAERRRLLGAPAGGPYRSARWITMAAAAVVLLSVGAALVLLIASQMPPAGTRVAAPGTTRPGTPGPIAAAGKEADKYAGREKGSSQLFRRARRDDAPSAGLQAGEAAPRDPHKADGRLAGTDVGRKKAQPTTAAVVAYAETFAINTDDLAATRHEVEQLLRANGLLAEPRTRPKDVGLQVQYLILEPTPDQLDNVRNGLKAVAHRQRVSQEPVEYEEVLQLAAAERSVVRPRAAAKPLLAVPEPAAPKPPPAKRPGPPAPPKAAPPAVPPAAPALPGPAKLPAPKPAPPARAPSPERRVGAKPLSKPSAEPAAIPPGADDRRESAKKKAMFRAEPPGEKIASGQPAKLTRGAKEAPDSEKVKRIPRKPPTARPARPEAPTSPATKAAADAAEPRPPEAKLKQTEEEAAEGKRPGKGERPPVPKAAAGPVAEPQPEAAPRPRPSVAGRPPAAQEPNKAGAGASVDAAEAPGGPGEKRHRQPARRTRARSGDPKEQDLLRPAQPTTQALGRLASPAEGSAGRRAGPQLPPRAVLITLNRLPANVASLRAKLLDAAKAAASNADAQAAGEAVRTQVKQAGPQKDVTTQK